MANGAQVALEDFSIPQFPREAGGLLALTLISQIKGSEYAEVLKRPFKVTHLPPSIQSLTLESFIQGYPLGFLRSLIVELPELRSLVVYSQHFTGTSDESSEDAVAFIKGAKKLRALHLLDAGISAGFVKGIAPSVKELEKPLMFMEISYTNRGMDGDFLKRIPAAELPLLIHPGLISCTFNVAPPERKKEESSDTSLSYDGIQVLPHSFSNTLIQKLTDQESAPKVMKHLNITMFQVSVDQLRKILAIHKGLMVLNVSVVVDYDSSYKKDLFEVLVTASNLEQIELVLCPTQSDKELDVTIADEGIEALTKACKKLSSLKVNQLRSQWTKSSLECSISDGKWHVDMRKAEAMKVPERPKSKTAKPVSV